MRKACLICFDPITVFQPQWKYSCGNHRVHLECAWKWCVSNYPVPACCPVCRICFSGKDSDRVLVAGLDLGFEMPREPPSRMMGAPVVFEGAAAGDGNEEGSGPAAIVKTRGGVQAPGFPAAAKSEAKGSKEPTAPTTVTAGAPAGVQAPGAPAAAELPRAREAKSSKDATAPTTIAAGAAAGSAAAGSAAAAAAPSAQANERGGIRAPGACLSAPCASTAHALAAYLRPARPTPAVPNASNAPAELLRPTLASGGAADAPTASAETGVHAQAPSVSAGVATLLPGAGPREAAAAAPSFSNWREVMNRRRQEREGRGGEDESGRAVSWWWGRYGAHAEAWWYRTESGEWRKDGAGRSFQ